MSMESTGAIQPAQGTGMCTWWGYIRVKAQRAALQATMARPDVADPDLDGRAGLGSHEVECRDLVSRPGIDSWETGVEAGRRGGNPKPN
jgi:hypothetical protein